MKKITLYLLFLLLISILHGCTKDINKTSPTLTETNNKVTPTVTPTITPTASLHDFFDISQYDGEWYSKNYYLVVDQNNNELYDIGAWLILDTQNRTIEIIDTSSPPMSRIALVYTTFSIEGTKGEFTFDDDGWGNAGTGTIDFKDDEIIINIFLTIYGGDNWEMFSGEAAFTRNKIINVTPNVDIEE